MKHKKNVTTVIEHFGMKNVLINTKIIKHVTIYQNVKNVIRKLLQNMEHTNVEKNIATIVK